MSALEVRPVRDSSDRMRFIKLAWQFYRDDPCWVPPLIADMKEFIHPRKGVFFHSGEAELFIAYRAGKPCGRLSAQLNPRHQQLYQDGKGFFGFFECEDDQETADALFAAAEQYLRDKGCNSLEGPYNFTIYDEIGVLIDGFETMPSVMTLHNPAYYGALIEGAGYHKAVDWHAFRVTAEAARGWSDRLIKLRDRIARRKGVNIRPMDRRRYAEEANRCKEIFNEAWDRNFGHVPMNEHEWKRVAKAFKMLIIPELSYFVEVNGRRVGFLLSARDANPGVRAIDGRLFPFGVFKLLREMKKAKRFRVVLMGMVEGHRNRGYEVALPVQTVQRGLEMGFEECEVSQIVETNEPMLRSLAHMPAERSKTWRIYRKDLGSS